MKVFLTGGGSGGHILPNIALIEELRKIQKTTPLALGYIGEKNGMEQELIEQEHVQFFPIYAGKLRRYWDLQNFFDPFKIIFGFFQSFSILARHRPDVLFSKGGFVSLPVCAAAACLRIPIVIHESDTTPGLTTKLTSKLARHICVAWPQTLTHVPSAKGMLTGIPIRSTITSGNSDRGYTRCGFTTKDKPVLLVIGGSLGAGALNEFTSRHLPTLTKEFNIIHITGKGKRIQPLSDYTGSYYQCEFVGNELFDFYALADIALARAGSTLLWEFAEIGLPALLVPLPGRASRGDQLLNAESYHTLFPHLSYIIPEESLTRESLMFGIEYLKQHKNTPQSTRLCGRELITQLLLSFKG